MPASKDTNFPETLKEKKIKQLVLAIKVRFEVQQLALIMNKVEI